MGAPGHAPADAFFLDTADGPRFCLYHAPVGECRGALVYLHPFAEEMNRSRRMAALQARAFAAQGIAVLLLDLHGCGDSAGDFGDASWDGWLRDIAAARGWLETKTGCTAGLWGLRLGALLAVCHAQRAPRPPARLLLWQPVTIGSGYLNGFLRLKLAGELLAGGSDSGGTDALREALKAGESLEIAGYTLGPALADGIDGADARALAPRCTIDWCEVVAAPERPLPPAAARVVETWRLQGSRVNVHLAAGPQFWAAPETVDCPNLIAASNAALTHNAAKAADA
ncbi:hydrolase 2, exosortase A system-associated [Massilia sp. YIM B02769]|uniref:hydrolase 2, exosortase A system-associated n=1 Tax=Massilia sp. YIM B02769 TaxID=3050129 RepID=UPI0025B68893|nr:hydrolase 2, exosortase A system-associated [Massilia sp. YIM B02769]MDN4056984.1 hydrolase 2, exosortase A system-associated [Massilia sp. YIM B02769]